MEDESGDTPWRCFEFRENFIAACNSTHQSLESGNSGPGTLESTVAVGVAIALMALAILMVRRATLLLMHWADAPPFRLGKATKPNAITPNWYPGCLRMQWTQSPNHRTLQGTLRLMSIFKARTLDFYWGDQSSFLVWVVSLN